MPGLLDFLFEGTPPPAVTTYDSSTTAIPEWLENYTQALIGKGTALAGQPYTPYTGPRIAAMTADQTAAFEKVRQAQGGALPYLNSAMSNYTAAANPYNPEMIQNFMNPYTENVTDRIAELGARNLSENLLPQVNDTFIRAGQFGSWGNQNLTSRALRDTQEAVLGKQAEVNMQATQNAIQSAESALNRQRAVGQDMGALGQLHQNMAYNDAATLEASGRTQQGQTQGQYDLAYEDFLAQQRYPYEQLGGLNALIRGLPYGTSTYSSTTGPGNIYQPSPLAQMASMGIGLSSIFGNKRGGRISVPDRRRTPAEVIQFPTRVRRHGALAALKAA